MMRGEDFWLLRWLMNKEKSSSDITFFFAAMTACAWSLPSVEIFYERLPNGSIGCRRNCRLAYAELCPPVACPPAVQPPLNRVCGTPDCSKSSDRSFLFPHVNPNKYFQCRPRSTMGDWEAIERNCGCETYFDYSKQRCVHPFEWESQCYSTASPPPSPVACIIDCPQCDDSDNEPTEPPNTIYPTTATSESFFVTIVVYINCDGRKKSFALNSWNCFTIVGNTL